MADPILIVGAGQAGASAISALRTLGCTEGIVWVGEEPHAAYERPPLSKAVLQDASAEAALPIHPAGYVSEHQIDLRLGVRVTALDVARHEAHCSDGRTLRYRACLLATGGAARSLPGLPPATPGVHHIRTLDDARGLRAALVATRGPVLVLGGGFLGLEVASTARALGREVTVVEAAARLLPRAFPEPFSDWLLQRARHAGVDVRVGRSCTQVQARDGQVLMQLDDGSEMASSLFVVAIGQAPANELARAAGIAVHPGNGGIRIDAQGRTSAPDVYAAGDCTSQVQPESGQELRLESWQGANEQGRLAAAAMIGASVPPRAHPWFWTDQFGCNIQMQGLPEPGLTFHLRGPADAAADKPKFLWFGLRGDRLVQAIAVNAGGDLRPLRPVFERGLAVDAARLVDEAVPLRTLARDLVAAAGSG